MTVPWRVAISAHGPQAGTLDAYARAVESGAVNAIKARFPGVPAALSLGRDMEGRSRLEWLAARRGELFPMRRLRACHADWVAVNRQLAKVPGLLGQCHRAGIKAMVWTVDKDDEMRRWLATSGSPC